MEYLNKSFIEVKSRRYTLGQGTRHMDLLHVSWTGYKLIYKIGNIRIPELINPRFHFVYFVPK